MPRRPKDLVDRDAEWKALTKAWKSDRAELLFVLGRRRVGKSFTLAPFARAVKGIYYQATRRTEADQLRTLTRIVAERFDDAALRRVPFADWEALFGYLLERTEGHPFFFVIDEFPYLESAAPALPSVLQSIIDHDLRDTRFKLVLSGSHISAMKRLEAADQPLYARRTRRIDLSPFSYRDAAAFVEGYAPIDRLRAYAIFGGTAGHLAMLDADEDLATNVIEQILEPGGRLHDEAMRFLDAFLADAAVHYSIIQAIGSGDRTWNRIANRIGKGAGSISRPMAWLTEMELVRRDVPVTVKNPARSKQAVYRLTDPYVAFWHRFVAPLVASGTLKAGSPAHAWRTRIAPHVEAHYGEVFEEICRDALWRVPGLCSFAPLAVGSWWKADSSEEIDVVAIGDDALLIGECKWGRVTGRDLAKLQRRAELVAADLSKPPRSTELLLFSASGKTDARVDEAVRSGVVRVVDAEALFEA